ncbi:hypothetical protein PAXINDRAFT_173212, partial [Paxillus involutus ATCC 200175]
AREWADAFFPDMKWSTSEYLTHADIRGRLKVFYEDYTELERCLVIWWRESREGDGVPGIFFPTGWAEDFKFDTTRKKSLRFKENETALKVKKALFEPLMGKLSYLKDIHFVTIYDPYNTC